MERPFIWIAHTNGVPSCNLWNGTEAQRSFEKVLRHEPSDNELSEVDQGSECDDSEDSD